MQKLLNMMVYLKTLKPAQGSYHDIIDRESQMMIHDIKESIKNPKDLKVLQEVFL